MSPQLQDFIKILEFTNKFQRVKRNQPVPFDIPERLEYIDEAIEIWKAKPGFFAEQDYVPDHKIINKGIQQITKIE